MPPERRAAIYDVAGAARPALPRAVRPAPSAASATPASTPRFPRRNLAASIAVAFMLLLSASVSFSLFVTTTGCSREPARPAGPAARPVPTTQEPRVYDVASPHDLLDVQARYLREAAAGFTGRFEVRFTASLPPLSWSLVPEASPGGERPLPDFDLVLIGHGAVVPAPGGLAARTVHLEGLVLTGPVGLSSQIEVRTAFTMRDCAVVDGRGTLPASPAPYLSVLAHGVRGQKSPATFTLERTWFVRNWQADDSTRGAALLGLGQHERDGGYFSEARIRDCVFLGNAFATELQLSNVLDVTIERTLLSKTWPSGVVIDASLAAAVRVIDSIFLVDNLARVAWLGPEVPPIEISGSRLYATAYTSQTPLPPSFRLTRSVVTSRAAIEAQLAPLEAAAALPVAMPPADLRQQLMQALQP